MVANYEQVPLHEIFHAQARRTPSLLAVADERDQLTYDELNTRVLQLGEYLRSKGVGPDKTVGIFLPPCVDYVVAMLAIMSAGGAYIPIELAYPPALIANLCADAKPVVVLTSTAVASKIVAAEAVLMDSPELSTILSALSSKYSPEELEARRRSAPPVTLDNLSFLVYSSGTTGEPKGISNPHRAPVLSYEWRFAIDDYKPGDRIACNVFFVWEAIRPLLRGAATFCVPAEVIYDGPALLEFLHKHQITEILFTPTLFNNLLSTVSSDLVCKTSSVKTILLNGEVVSCELAKRALSILPHITFYNLYSISECHEVAMTDLRSYDLNTGAFCPVGFPSVLTPPYLLTPDGKTAPQGEEGELYIGGPLLARDYLNREQMTAERFPPNPFASEPPEGPRMYRTGDRAKFLPNGMLTILGRCNFMVKIRGYSVVLGAIEEELKKLVALSNCAVLAIGEEGTEKTLVAFLVEETKATDGRLRGLSIDPRTGHCPEVRTLLEARLPHYMIPGRFIALPNLPLHPASNKLDSRKLANMVPAAWKVADTNSTASMQDIPSTSVATGNVTLANVQAAISAIWDQVLQLPPGTTELDSNFLALGGQSLSAARVISTLNTSFGVKLSVISLLSGCVTPSIQAQAIVAARASNSSQAISAQKSCAETLEAVRAAAVLPANFLRRERSPAIPLAKATRIFLTGATGYLGVHLLVELLEKSQAHFVCLARSGSLDAILEQYGLQERAQAAFLPWRVTVIKGDLSLPHFGLEDSCWSHLCQTVNGVIHCGAVVNLGATWKDSEKVNVGGTLEVLKLAISAQPGTTLLHISSNGIFPRDGALRAEDADTSLLPSLLGSNDGYGLSKWTGETLVRAAHDKCGLPTVIVRIGNVGWNSKTGLGNRSDFQSMLIAGCVRMGRAPLIPNGVIEMTPIDYVTSSLLTIGADSELANKGAILHCEQPTPVAWSTVLSWLDELVGPLVRESWDEWVRHVTARGAGGEEDARLAALVNTLPGGDQYICSLTQMDCAQFDEVVKFSRPNLSISSLKLHLSAFGSRKRTRGSDHTISPTKRIRAPSSSADGPLEGRVAVVTGASSGIGRAIALGLARAGCVVVIAARRMEELNKTREEIEQNSSRQVRIESMVCDVTKRGEVLALVKHTEAHVGPIDIVVNNAGVMYYQLMKNVIWEEIDNTIAVNCVGATNVIGAVLPLMVDRQRGHIINITSDAGRKGFPGLAVYSGSKFYLEGMSQALRKEVLGFNIRVTCIQPGNVDTPLASLASDKEGVAAYGMPSGAQILRPEDIAQAVLYAATQPDFVAVNEILVEPRGEPA